MILTAQRLSRVEARLAALHRPRAAAIPDAVALAERCGLDLDDWQRDLRLSRERQAILLCARQTGKSTVTGLLALHTILTMPQALVLVVSPSLRQSAELTRRVVTFYNVIGRPIAAVAESVLHLELANGARLAALPGSEGTIRGYSAPDLVIVDEASRVEDDLYFGAVRPMRASKPGRLVLLSTPAGRQGFFFATWFDGGPSWHRAKITAQDCPRISAEYLREERESMPDQQFSREYRCEFLDSELSAFASEDIEAALDPTVLPLFGGGSYAE